MPTYQNNNGVPNPNSNGDANANSAKLYKLNAATNKTGLGITLKVMAGDQLSILGKSYWFNSGGNYSQKFDVPVSSILDAFLGSPAMVGKGLTTTGITTTGLTDALNGFRTRTENVDAPWAYINWIFFDEQFNYAGGGFDRVDGNGVLKPHILVNRDDLKAPKNGYVFVYCSNESQENVFFDNLQVIHTRGPLLEETHYYPFGLMMAGISSKAMNFGTPENKYKFNDGNELQINEFSDGSGLELYDASFRTYDPQIARFHQLDPLSDMFESCSPYVFALNNPILMNDPFGLAADTAVQGVPLMPAVVVTPNNPPLNPSEVNGPVPVGPAPMPSAMVPFIPSESDFVVEPEKPDYKWYEFFKDHNPGGDFLYELNKYNPLASGVNAIYGATTGNDTYGTSQNSGDVGTNLFSAIVPAFRLESTIANTTLSATRQGISKTLSNPNNIAHILQAKHNLHLLLPKTGGGLNIIRRLYLSLGQSGKLPRTGQFQITVNIYGYDVTIKGAVINGIPRIGTAYIK